MRFFSIIAFVFTFSLCRSDSAREISNDVTLQCIQEVENAWRLVEQLAQKNEMAAAAWEMWQCLDDTSILQDAYAVCNILGNIISNVTGFQVLRDYYIQEQKSIACHVCQKAEAWMDEFSEDQVTFGLKWLQTMTNTEFASSIRLTALQPGVLRSLIQPLFPKETCSQMVSHCAKNTAIALPPIPEPVVAVLKSVLKNVTYCLECAGCETAVLYTQMEILPNPNLPTCMVQLVQNRLCPMLNITLPFDISDGYELCVQLINKFADKILASAKVLAHPNLVCDTALKVCDDQRRDPLKCVCNNIRVPKYLQWMMPCGKQSTYSGH